MAKVLKLIKSDFDQLFHRKVEPNDLMQPSDKPIYTKFARQFVRPKDCPIARALKREGYEEINVSSDDVNCRKNGKPFHFLLKTDLHGLLNGSVEIFEGADHCNVYYEIA